MSNLKPRFPLSLPSRGSPAWLPALLVPLLGLVAIAQLALPRDVTLPPPGAAGRGARATLPGDTDSVGIPAALTGRTLFSPAGAGGGEPAATDLLDGAVFAGAVQLGSRRVAVVMLPQGKVRYLAPGGEIAGWRLAGFAPDGVRLVRGATEMTAAFGQHAGTSSTQSQAKDAEQ